LSSFGTPKRTLLKSELRATLSNLVPGKASILEGEFGSRWISPISWILLGLTLASTRRAAAILRENAKLFVGECDFLYSDDKCRCAHTFFGHTAMVDIPHFLICGDHCLL
jgi:hypothetical protein